MRSIKFRSVNMTTLANFMKMYCCSLKTNASIVSGEYVFKINIESWMKEKSEEVSVSAAVKITDAEFKNKCKETAIKELYSKLSENEEILFYMKKTFGTFPKFNNEVKPIAFK